MNEFENYPGGLPAIIFGFFIAAIIGIVSIFNLFAGLGCLCVVGILLFLAIINVIKSETLLTILSAVMAGFPVFVFIYLAFLFLCWVFSLLILFFLF